MVTAEGSTCVDRMAILYGSIMFRVVSLLERWKKEGLSLKVNVLPALRWLRKKLKERRCK